MKKAAILIFLFIIILTFTSCTKENFEPSADSSSNHNNTAGEKTVTNIISNIYSLFKLNRDNSSDSGTIKSGLLKNSTEFKITDSNGNILITNSDITGITAGYDPAINSYYIEIEFSETGKTSFFNATNDNIGKSLNIYINGELISSPMVNEAVNSDKAIISGNMDRENVLAIFDTLTQ